MDLTEFDNLILLVNKVKENTEEQYDNENIRLTDTIIELTGILTQRFGYNCKIEDIKMDLWKERIWNLIENAGLLMPLPRHMQDKEEILTDENIEEIVDEIVELGPTEEDIQMIDGLIPELEESFMEEFKTEE